MLQMSKICKKCYKYVREVSKEYKKKCRENVKVVLKYVKKSDERFQGNDIVGRGKRHMSKL